MEEVTCELRDLKENESAMSRVTMERTFQKDGVMSTKTLR